MSPRTPTLALTEPTMWRKLLAKVHPDAGGSHELFIWVVAVRDVVCGGELHIEAKPRREQRSYEPPPDNRERIPYAPYQDFEAGTREALRMAEELGKSHKYGGLLALLADCEPMENYAYQQERGASYKQLAAIGHTVGMSGAERSGWYAVAKGVPLSERHAAHILGRLKSAVA